MKYFTIYLKYLKIELCKGIENYTNEIYSMQIEIYIIQIKVIKHIKKIKQYNRTLYNAN